MTSQSQDKARQLLDAQVRFLLQELTPERVDAIVREEITYLYQQMDLISLNEAMSADKIKATAHRYALEMEIGGAIPELFGEIANIIYEHPAQESTTIGEIFSDELAEALLEKVFEAGGGLDLALRNIQKSDPFKAFLAEVMFLALKGYLLEQNRLLTSVPLLANGLQKLRNLMEDRAPQLKDGIEDNTRTLLERSISNTLNLLDQLLDQEQYRDQALIAVQHLWSEVSAWPLARFREIASESDLQEWMVFGYEFWREFRETEFLTAIIDAAVEFFFSKYGEDSLQKIVTEMGVTYDMIESEILNYSVDFASLLVQQGIAETVIRRRLEAFYASEETLALLN